MADKVNITPSIIGGAPLKLQIYNFDSTTATGFWVTPAGILQSLPGAASVPPTGSTTPITINSFRLAAVLLMRPRGGGVWKHFAGSNPTPFIILGTPPPGFKAGLTNGKSDGSGGELADDGGPEGKKKKVVKVKNVTNTTITGTPPAPPAAEAPAATPAEPEKSKRKAPRIAKGPQVAEFLRIHNAARKAVGVAPLAWSNDLAAAAQEWAEQIADSGKLQHQPGLKYGENLGMGSGDYSPATAANSWLAEKAKYSADAVAKPAKKKMGKIASNADVAGETAHYTQMVWGKSTTVGFGVATTKDGKVVVVANYNPPGNVEGEALRAVMNEVTSSLF